MAAEVFWKRIDGRLSGPGIVALSKVARLLRRFLLEILDIVKIGFFG